jgi:hypothetical protein
LVKRKKIGLGRWRQIRGSGTRQNPLALLSGFSALRRTFVVQPFARQCDGPHLKLGFGSATGNAGRRKPGGWITPRVVFLHYFRTTKCETKKLGRGNWLIHGVMYAEDRARYGVGY